MNKRPPASTVSEWQRVIHYVSGKYVSGKYELRLAKWRSSNDGWIITTADGSLHAYPVNTHYRS